MYNSVIIRKNMKDEQNLNATAPDPQTNASAATTKRTPKQALGPEATETEFERKRKEAMLAMEGDEGRLRRERAEQRKKEEEIMSQVSVEKAGLTRRLSEIARQKEELETKWMQYSDKKAPLDARLAVLVEQEVRVESDGEKINQEEHNTVDPKVRQEIEKKRWENDDLRRKIEKEKWDIEDKTSNLTKFMEENKLAYQKVLDEEDQIARRVDEIDRTVKMYSV